jgi:hypothetical protein
MECRRCAACGQAFRPRAQIPQQRYCGLAACQRERRRRWQTEQAAGRPRLPRQSSSGATRLGGSEAVLTPHLAQLRAWLLARQRGALSLPQALR